MPTFQSWAAFGREVEKMAEEVDGAKKRKLIQPIADKAVKLATQAASADLGGDPKFSGWEPELVTVIKWTRSSAAIVQPTRQSAGPWTVAEQGRNKGNASGFAGPGVNRRTGATSRTKSGGLRKQRSRQARRWNGYTRGKNTATKAAAAMDKMMPGMVEDGWRKVLSKHFDVT